MTSKLSFIIIGRNEAKNLDRCITSIYDVLTVNKITDYEIIYVDSNSTDESVAITAAFEEVKIFVIKGACNAAVARNIGAKESTGDVLFFIDADMKLQPEFFTSLWDHQKGISYDMLSGELLDVVDGKIEPRKSNKLLPGGIYLIKRSVWNTLGGMHTKFRTGEDYDLGLRLMENGFRFERKDAIITHHYTVPYLDKSRIWKAVWNKSAFFFRSVLLRNHLFSPFMYKVLWRNEKSFMLLILTIVALIIDVRAGLAAFLAYLALITFRAYRNIRNLPLLEMIWYYMVIDSLSLFYLFAFYPKNIKEVYVRFERS